MVGAKIRKARKEAGLTQAQLAGTELSRSLISEIERNKRNLSTATLHILAQKLNKPLEYFVVEWRVSDAERALLLINHAHACIEIGDSEGIRLALDALKGFGALPDDVKARMHELIAWHEQKEGRPLGAVNHALTAEVLFAAEGRRDKQWYCCYLAAHATYASGLYSQALEMCNKALGIFRSAEDMPSKRQLTLYLLGSIYFALGKIESAQKCYTEIAASDGEEDKRSLLQAYHGKAICAQQLGNTVEALRWAEQAALQAEQCRDMEFYASSLITWGSCLVKMGHNDKALAVLWNIDNDSRFAAHIAHTARRELLLCLAEQDPYPGVICISLEQYLSAVLLVAPKQGGYEDTKTQWAVAKSRLRRAAKGDIVSVIQQFASLFLALSHSARAAEVLAYGASLMERNNDSHAAYTLLKEAYRLRRDTAVEVGSL
ncbi:MAG: helix-turn-helix transcriptional regulator [Thermaerobacter sp.]|nr:helix-turn-helix transcriptional regulator [Thermaerobacter sp.]